MTVKAPKRRARAGAAKVAAMAATAPGRNASAAVSGVRPATSWRYWVRKNTEPPKPMQVTRLAVMAARNRPSRKRVTSIMGTGRRSWRRTKATAAAVPTTTTTPTVVDHPPSAAAFIP